MSQISVKPSQEIARPLNILIPLIRKDFDEGEKAGTEYYRAAGEKLNEAEAHFDRITDFYVWAEKNFGKSRGQLRTYMALATASFSKSFKSIAEYKRTDGNNPSSGRESGRVFRDWTKPVDAIAQRARDEARRIAIDDGLSRREEREAERKLALRLIDIGYKVLARELHPDKGGSRDAMMRLNRIRDRLKEIA